MVILLSIFQGFNVGNSSHHRQPFNSNRLSILATKYSSSPTQLIFWVKNTKEKKKKKGGWVAIIDLVNELKHPYLVVIRILMLKDAPVSNSRRGYFVIWE